MDASPSPALLESIRPAQRIKGRIPLRFDEVTCDGRIRLEALVGALGLVWQDKLHVDPTMTACVRADIVPVITRLVLTGFGGPFDVAGGLEVEAGYVYSDLRGARASGVGLDVVAEAWGSRAGERSRAGTVLVEQAFTRPSAPPSERRVTTLPAAPTEMRARAMTPPAAVLERPLDGASTPEMSFDFGVAHTDPNGHVSSLLYPRLFEIALLRRLREHPAMATLLSRELDVRFRRPFFAGEHVVVRLATFDDGDRIGAVGTFGDDDASDARVFVRMVMGAPREASSV